VAELAYPSKTSREYAYLLALSVLLLSPHDAVLGSLTDADMAEENVNNVLLDEDASTHK
jgi:hypothetical protein